MTKDVQISLDQNTITLSSGIILEFHIGGSCNCCFFGMNKSSCIGIPCLAEKRKDDRLGNFTKR
jgi:hypothetical protein